MYNFDEYENPQLYDIENQCEEEIDLILKWYGDSKDTILDLCCGTGRVTIPLAKKGINTIGVDIHKGMLEHAISKSKNLNLNIQWIDEDCRNLHLNEKVSMAVMAGNSFQHFLTNEDQEAFLKSTNKLLKSEGIFIFDTRFPSVEELLQPPVEEYYKTFLDSHGRQCDVSYFSTYNSLTQIQHYITTREFENPDSTTEKLTSNIYLRYTFPQEMKRLLTLCGFQIIEIYSDWKETILDSNSYSMIYVCKKV
ncbi:class I SAM-dependent methyltransferase [Clostridium sp.]|uniref:class I SAM-dependent methyltransferase n=1 Tax=Clostridium sp. TaxID=1506 RepID=UPI003463AF03